MSDKAYAAMLAENDRIFAALLAKPSADTLATAAAFARGTTPRPDRGDAGALAARAVALAPDRPELRWLQLSICKLNDCNLTPLENRLKSLDSDNGMLWLGDLERLYRTTDESAVTAAVVEMGSHSRFSLYINQLVVMVFDAYAIAAPTMSVAQRATNAWGLVAAFAIPPIQPVSKSCAFDSLTIPGRRDACQALLRKLEMSDAIIIQSIALGIQQRWWPVDSPEAAELQAQRRRMHYIMQRAGRLRMFRLNHDSTIRMAATRRYAREEDAAIAVLKSFGDAADPPAAWKDPWR